MFFNAVCLFESPFDMMGLSIGLSIEGLDARMNGGPDIEREQVEWQNQLVFQLEGPGYCEGLTSFPFSVFESDLTMKAVHSSWRVIN
jgi:hypothetical protein